MLWDLETDKYIYIGIDRIDSCFSHTHLAAAAAAAETGSPTETFCGIRSSRKLLRSGQLFLCLLSGILCFLLRERKKTQKGGVEKLTLP